MRRVVLLIPSIGLMAAQCLEGLFTVISGDFEKELVLMLRVVLAITTLDDESRAGRRTKNNAELRGFLTKP